MPSEQAQTAGDYVAPELVCHGTIVEMTGGQQSNVSGGGGTHTDKDILGIVGDILHL